MADISTYAGEEFVMTKVLITGASGLIGSVLRGGLSDRYELSGVDRRGIDGFDLLVADSTDLDSIRPAFEGIDVVVDLARHATSGMFHGSNGLFCTSIWFGVI